MARRLLPPNLARNLTLAATTVAIFLGPWLVWCALVLPRR